MAHAGFTAGLSDERKLSIIYNVAGSAPDERDEKFRAGGRFHDPG
jgi:hypothetical protein